MKTRWNVKQINLNGTQGEVTFEKGYHRIEGSHPKTIESLQDVVIEILEGGFLDEKEIGTQVVSFSVTKVLEGEENN